MTKIIMTLEEYLEHYEQHLAPIIIYPSITIGTTNLDCGWPAST